MAQENSDVISIRLTAHSNWQKLNPVADTADKVGLIRVMYR